MKPKKEKYFFEYEREAKAKKNKARIADKKATEKPKVKITIKGSTSASNLGKSLKPGAMNQSTKTVKSKPRNPIAYEGGQASGYRNPAAKKKSK